MKEQANTDSTKTQILGHPEFRVSVANFGPISSGSVDLRPLTVFVGPSNTGKDLFRHSDLCPTPDLRRFPTASGRKSP